MAADLLSDLLADLLAWVGYTNICIVYALYMHYACSYNRVVISSGWLSAVTTAVHKFNISNTKMHVHIHM